MINAVKQLNYEVKISTGGFVQEITFEGTTKGLMLEHPIKGEKDTISMLYAWCDLRLYDLYTHPLTKLGLHIEKDVDIHTMYNDKIGVSSVDLASEFFPRVYREEYPYRWAGMSIRNKYVSLEKLGKTVGGCEYLARLHDFVDILLAGYGATIQCLPYSARRGKYTGRSNFDTVLLQLAAPTVEEAWELRQTSRQNYYDRKSINAGVERAIKNGTYIRKADFVAGAIEVDPKNLIIYDVQGNEYNMAKMAATSFVAVRKDGKKEVPDLSWNPNSHSSQLGMVELVTHGYMIQLPSVVLS